MDDSRENNRMLQESLFCREDGEKRRRARTKERQKRRRRGKKEREQGDEDRGGEMKLGQRK